jgi:hypothetical protein
VEEVVALVIDAKPKVTDIPVIVALSTAMHERYKEFQPNLLNSLCNLVGSKGGVETVKARRVYLSLLTEFLLCGLVSETKNLMKVVVDATGGKDGNYVVSDAHIVVAFSKRAGHEIFGVTPSSVTDAIAQIQKEQDGLQQQAQNDNAVVASSDLV